MNSKKSVGNSSGTPSRPPRPSDRGELPARWATLRILSDLREGRRTARESIDDLIDQAQLAPQEAGLTTELVMGVVRHRLTLAKVLGTYAARGWQRVNRQLQSILMIGAYQIIWMDTVPAFAAVNEAVNQARSEGGVRAGRFVNAVLRQLLRDIEHRRLPCEQADPVRAIPVSDTDCLQLRRRVLTDPGVNPAAYLAEATSHPAWLTGRWIHHFGREAAEAICRAGMRRPLVLLRPNRLRIDAGGLASRLRQEGFQAELTPSDGVALLGNVAGLMRSEAFQAGLFQPQDPTAMKAVQHMDLTAGQTIIDLCAGVGTKTTQMAERMNDRGLILASDKETGRLDQLQSNCDRLGITSVRVVPSAEIEAAAAGLDRLDWILVDAPCSNTGVLARRPEARYRVDVRALEGLAAIQLGLLRLAARLARPGTRLLYTTCSLEPEENEKPAAAFAKEHPDWMMQGSELTLPSSDGPPASRHDGGYWSSWVRK